MQVNHSLLKYRQPLSKRESKFKLNTEGLLINSGTIREDPISSKQSLLTTKIPNG